MYFFLLKREKQCSWLCKDVSVLTLAFMWEDGYLVGSKTMQKLVYKRFNKLAHFSATMALTNILSVADDTSSKLAVF